MRIGLTGGAGSTDEVVRQAQQAEADGFASLWFASGVLGDPLAAMTVAGRATTAIELGTAVLQTYPCHPLLQANRVAAVAEAMGRPGFTLGLGPSHEASVRDVYGLSYDRPGTNTDEYVSIVTSLLRGDEVDVRGTEWTTRSAGRMTPVAHPVPVLLAAMSPRMLRVAGTHADGTILWMASAPVIESRIAPALHVAAERAGRPAPRIVAGLPVAVHDEATQARAACAATATSYASVPAYRRVLEAGGASAPADVAVVGDEKSVRAQLRSLIAVGVTDVWAAPFPVGDDPRASLRRTRELLRELAAEPD